MPTTYFKMSINVQSQTNFNITFQIILYDASDIHIQGRYTFLNYTIGKIDRNNNISQTL
jgi:hypothetical protein